MSNFFSKAVNNSTWTAIGSLITAVIGFLFAGLTIRWLGQAEAGFAIAIGTIVGVNNTFSGLGLGSAATRLISNAYEQNNTQEIKKIAGVCLTTSLAFGLFGFFLFSFGSTWIVQWTKYDGNVNTGKFYCFLLGFVFLLQQVRSYFAIFLEALQRFDLQTKLNTAFLLANGLLGITLLKAFPSIITLGVIQLSLSFLNCLCTAFIVSKILGFSPRIFWHQSVFIELWSFGKWVYLTQIQGLLMDGLDKVILVSMFGSFYLAFYTFSQRIYVTVHGMLVGQSSYLFPMLSAQGDKLESVSRQIEDHFRWFVGLLSGFTYSGIIISSSVLLSTIVNPEFSQQASFQLFIFCWVGYFHANAIVQFFFGLSKGDAQGNWFFHVVVGLGYLPLFIAMAFLFGFQYAVLGQLMTVFGTIYLSHRLKPNLNLISLMYWLTKPLYSSLLLMVFSSSLHVIFLLSKASDVVQIIAVMIFFLVSILLIPRIEIHYFRGAENVRLLIKAMSLIFGKLGISSKFISRLMGY